MIRCAYCGMNVAELDGGALVDAGGEVICLGFVDPHDPYGGRHRRPEEAVMDAQSGKVFMSRAEALADGTNPRDLVEVAGTPEAIRKLSRSVREASHKARARKRRKARRKAQERSRRSNRR